MLGFDRFDITYANIGNERIARRAAAASAILAAAERALFDDPRWSSVRAFDLEVRKCFLRGVLRYSGQAADLLSEIRSTLSLGPWHRPDLSYFTLLYPIIHLVGDESETSHRASLHTDSVGVPAQFTIWTPIAAYDYPALSYLPGGAAAARIYKHFDWPNNESRLLRDIPARVGDCLLWGGHFPHRGNVNTSDRIVSALVIRVTAEPMIYEPAVNEHYPRVDPVFDFLRFRRFVDAAVDVAHRTDDISAAISQCAQLLDSCADAGQSFAFSVLAQRPIEGSPPNLSAVFDIMSLLSGAQNLVSLQRLLPAIGDKDRFLATLCEHDVFSVLPRETYQWKKITGAHFDRAPPWRI